MREKFLIAAAYASVAIVIVAAVLIVFATLIRELLRVAFHHTPAVPDPQTASPLEKSPFGIKTLPPQ